MPHTYVSAYFHVVFSTSERRPTISPVFQTRLWAFMGGIPRKNGFRALAVGGTSDHVHLLLSIPATLPLAKAVQLVKGGSCKWVHDTFPRTRAFGWQQGYSVFSIGVSQLKPTIAYIANQERHHRRISYQEEVRAFLKRHGINFDEHHAWG